MSVGHHLWLVICFRLNLSSANRRKVTSQKPQPKAATFALSILLAKIRSRWWIQNVLHLRHQNTRQSFTFELIKLPSARDSNKIPRKIPNHWLTSSPLGLKPHFNWSRANSIDSVKISLSSLSTRLFLHFSCNPSCAWFDFLSQSAN